ncbi:hypothetical protein D1AOALGA4SA_8573 [Olavius algarvensis Delta 1 endosymbiont]|nr:hypothetical protein D1AOALGA4SA_8573 [Olavius algarvensis Delta 1 endosymbiont]
MIRLWFAPNREFWILTTAVMEHWSNGVMQNASHDISDSLKSVARTTLN